MNILMLARALPAHGAGGMETVTWDLARALALAGVGVSILTTNHPQLRSGETYDGVVVHTVEASHNRYTQAWWRLSRAAFEGGLSSRHDVVLGVSAAANGVVGALANGSSQVFVFQAHGTSSGEVVSKLRSKSPKSIAGSVKNIYWGLFLDPIYRKYDSIVAVGDTVYDQLTKGVTRAIVGNVPVHLIRNGINVKDFLFDAEARRSVRGRLGLSGEDRVILSLSRLHKQKGVYVGLSAFNAAAQSGGDLRYIIAGDGPERDNIRRQIADYHLENRVMAVGDVPKTDVPELYSAADVFLFPTVRTEAGITLTVMEALASGLPVIASGGLPANMTAIRSGDVGAFAQALRAVRPALDRHCLLPSEYRIESVAGAYLDHFEHLLTQRANRPN